MTHSSTVGKRTQPHISVPSTDSSFLNHRCERRQKNTRARFVAAAPHATRALPRPTFCSFVPPMTTGRISWCELELAVVLSSWLDEHRRDWAERFLCWVGKLRGLRDAWMDVQHLVTDLKAPCLFPTGVKTRRKSNFPTWHKRKSVEYCSLIYIYLHPLFLHETNTR